MTHLKTIPGFPAYCATKDGRIWSWKTKRFLKLNLTRGYCYVSLRQNSQIKQKQVHRLVLETFVRPCPEGMECCHNNGVKADNRLENLRWDTKKNNCKDAIKHGVHSCLHQRKKGEMNSNAKLKEKDIRIIIYMFKTGLFSQIEIAKIYNVRNTSISHVVNKKTWKHIWSDSRTKLI